VERTCSPYREVSLVARTSSVSKDKKLAVVLSVLKGEVTAAEAGRQAGVTEQTVHNWKRAFLEAGVAGLEHPRRAGRSSREAQLEAEIEDLKTALGETVAELRVVKRGRSTLQILKGSS
jgi:transposase